MNRPTSPQPPESSPPEPEVQQGTEHGIAHEEALERIVRRNPERDEPRVDSVEPNEQGPKR